MQQHPERPKLPFGGPAAMFGVAEMQQGPILERFFWRYPMYYSRVIFERVLTGEKRLLRVATGLGGGCGGPSYKHRAPGSPPPGFNPFLDIAIYDRGGAIRPPNNSSYQRK